jgi:hypothetical protein
VFGLPYNPAYWGLIAEAQQTLPQEYDLSALVRQIGMDLRATGETPPADFNVAGISSLTEGLFMRRHDPSNATRGFHDTAGRVAEIASIDHDVEIGAVDFPGKAVVHVVDLSSLEGEHARSTLALAVLRALWKTSREQWWHRHMTKKKAQRTPTFVVVDEAHHLCPAEQMESPIGTRVREALLEIATEGRKYGLWLVLGTQRSTRLHPTILSEINNFMLMRTTSPTDLECLSKLLSNEKIKSDLANLERANPVKSSWGFLAGEWARDSYEKVKVSSRRTAHIEGNFEADEWISRR